MFIRALALSVIFSATSLFAAPSGGRVTAGNGDISNPLNLIQHSNTLATSWESFDIASGEVVNITQPSTSALISIKVRNGTETNINGTLNANGKVALENPAGVLFGAGSVVNVGGLLATAGAGAVQANGIINAPSGEVHLQSLADNNAVNVGGVIEAQRIIVEGAGEVKLDSTATLTASKEVLVGGGFQGKGTIANSQKTIVEAGSLITSPRVIIWSDVSTNFQGSIDAEGGFVEVSGKQHLASFDIFKVKAAELLLDPANITIGTATTNDAEIYIAPPDEKDGTATQDDGTVASGDGSGDFVISAAAIASYVGAVSLAAGTAITVNTAITKANGALTLAAPTININQNITMTGQNLTLTASTSIVFGARAITLSGAAVSLTSTNAQTTASDQDLAITATGRLTLSGNYNIGTGNASLTFAGTSAQAPAPTSFLTDDLTLTYTAASGNSITYKSWMGAIGRNLTFISLNTFISSTSNINLGDGDLTLDVRSSSFVIAGSSLVTITAKTINLSALAFSFTSSGGLTLDASGDMLLKVGGVLANPDINLTLDADGEIIFVGNTTLAGTGRSAQPPGSITLGGTIKVQTTNNDGDITLNNLSMTAVTSISFVVGKATSITANNITLNAPTAGTASNGNLTLEPAGTLSLTGAFNLGTGSLILKGSTFTQAEYDKFTRGGSGFIYTGSTNFTPPSWAIAANKHLSVVATKANIVVPATSLKLGATGSGGDLRLEAQEGGVLIFTAATTITAKAAVIISRGTPSAANQSLTLTANGTLNLGGKFNLGSGSLTASAAAIVVGEEDTSPATSISATNISLTGSSTFQNASRPQFAGLRGFADMTLTATGTLTLASTFINFNGVGGTDDLTLNAPTIIFPQTTSIIADTLTLGGTIKAESGTGGSATKHELTIAPTAQLNLSTARATVISGSIIRLSSPTKGAVSNKALTINATSAINIGGAFDTGIGAISITSGTSQPLNFSTTLETSLAAVAMTLTSTGGTPTASNKDLTLTASGNITLQGSFDAGNDATNGGTMRLTAGEGSGSGKIIFTTATLKAKAIFLTQDSEVFAEDSPATFTIPNSGKPQVSYLGSETQTPRDWFQIDGFTTLSLTDEDIVIATLLGTGDFARFSIVNGLLDFGSDIIELTTNRNIIFPAEITQITAGQLTLSAANIGTGDGTGNFTNDLTINIVGTLTLPAITFTSNGNLTLEANNFRIREGSGFTLAANDITITARATKGQDDEDGTVFASPFAAVAFNATNNLTISISNMPIGTGETAHNLTLSAGTQILFTRSIESRAQILTFNSPIIKAESTDGVGVITKHNLNFDTRLNPGGKINFATNKATTITANDITLNSRTKGDAGNQDLSLIATGTLTLIGSFDLGTKTAPAGTTLTLEGDAIFTSNTPLKADNIIIKAKTSISATGATFTARNDVTFSTPFVDAGNDSGTGNINITAGGQILFTENGIFLANSMTFNSGTIKAQTTGDTPMDVSPTISGNITFTQATTISGADITLRFSTASTTGGQDLTVNASGNLTLEGVLDAGAGTLRFTAGSGAGTGTIMFATDIKPTLTAAAIFLAQDGAVFVPSPTAPATFTIPSSGKPTASYTGTGDTQADPAAGDWFVISRISVDMDDEDIDIMAILGMGAFADFSIVNGVLDFGDEEIVLATTGNIIFPDSPLVVRGTVLTIRAGSIRNATDSAGITKKLTFVASESIVIDASITSTHDITIRAPAVGFSGTKPLRLNARNIMIELPDGTNMPSDNPNGNNQNVELVASGDIMLENSINVGFATLKLQAAGEIMTTHADVMVMGNRVVYQAGTIGGALTIISMNDIRLLGNIETGGNVVLQAGGSIITPEAATTIEATGASSDITFEQRYALRQSFALTLKAAGEITIIGKLDRGTADITLDGGTLDLTRASLTAATLTCSNAAAATCQ